MSTEFEKLSEAISEFSRAVERQTRVLELLTEGMKPGTEAAILGVSVSTVSRRRKARRLERIIGGTK